jgi:ribosomal protein S18 acetylase RimI-like enzyme
MADRVDENGAAYAGSQLQTQLYVNKRTEKLDDAIRAAFAELADAAFSWRSPLADEHYAEYWDAAFLKCLNLDEYVDALAKFWPERGGPHWDALAVVALPHQPRTGVLLAEGKSYPDEMLKGSPVGATDPTSKCTIEKGLAWTQGTLGIPFDLAGWTGPLYQNANRLAHVYWLRARGVSAWLVHLLFTDDPHGPTNVVEWEAALKKADAGLGLTGVAVDAAAHILLPAGTRDELLG